MKPKIIRCACSHDYQDKRYGLGMRVANATKEPDNYRCTVCSLVHKTPTA